MIDTFILQKVYGYMMWKELGFALVHPRDIHLIMTDLITQVNPKFKSILFLSDNFVLIVAKIFRFYCNTWTCYVGVLTQYSLNVETSHPDNHQIDHKEQYQQEECIYYFIFVIKFFIY